MRSKNLFKTKRQVSSSTIFNSRYVDIKNQIKHSLPTQRHDRCQQYWSKGYIGVYNSRLFSIMLSKSCFEERFKGSFMVLATPLPYITKHQKDSEAHQAKFIRCRVSSAQHSVNVARTQFPLAFRYTETCHRNVR